MAIEESNTFRDRPQSTNHITHSQKRNYCPMPNQYQNNCNWPTQTNSFDSIESLKEQIWALKKKLNAKTNENTMLKTEKRRMEQMISSNNRKLKRLLNTFGDSEMLQKESEKILPSEHRKLASTELIDMLHLMHSKNVAMRQTLQTLRSQQKNEKSYEKELVECQGTVQKLNDDLNQKKSEILGMEKEMRSLLQTVGCLKNISEAMKKEIDGLKEEKETMSKERMEREKELRTKLEFQEKYQKICNRYDGFFNYLMQQLEAKSNGSFLHLFCVQMNGALQQLRNASNESEVVDIHEMARKIIETEKSKEKEKKIKAMGLCDAVREIQKCNKH